MTWRDRIMAWIRGADRRQAETEVDTVKAQLSKADKEWAAASRRARTALRKLDVELELRRRAR